MIDHELIFRDPILNKQLFEQGYITLPFLESDEIAKLRELFWTYHSQEEVQGLYVSAHYKEEDQIQRISDSIQQIFKRAIDEHIENGMTLGGTFISKPPHQTEPLQPHQDWSIVDESRFRSYTIWVPLDDVTEENGCMYVLPKSHDYVRGYRHISIDSVFGQIYDTVWQHMEPVHLKAGEAIVFDHALGHASKPNTSEKIRIAATYSLISNKPEMRFYWNNNGVVEEYVGESDFYNTPEAKTGPICLRKVRHLDFKPHQLTQEEFLILAGVEQPMAATETENRGGLINWFKKLVR